MMDNGYTGHGVLTLLALVGLTVPASARVWIVEASGFGDVPTIHEAVAAASNGDEILVRPGLYKEAWLELQGKRLWVHSSGGWEVTAIQLADGAPPPIVWIHEGESRETVVEGFWIRKEIGQDGGCFAGGGIHIQDSSPTIRDCRVERCTAAYGAGLACQGAGCNARVDGCSFFLGYGVVGGGVTVFQGAQAEFEDCRIWLNLGQESGGGIAVVGAGTRAVFTRCTTMVNKTDDWYGDATAAWIAYGAWARFDYCTFWNNHNSSEVFNTGIKVDGASSDIRACCISQNDDCGIDGGGQTTVSCSDVWGQFSLQMINVIDGGGNFSADPLLCTTNWSYDPVLYLREGSPCIPGNHPDGIDCGWIGGLEIGCLPVAGIPEAAIEATTWGRIKWRMREAPGKQPR